MPSDQIALEFHERIKELMKYFYNGKQLRMRDATGISQPMIHRMVTVDKKTGKYPLPSFSTLWQIHRALPNVNLNWLFFGEGKMLDRPIYQTDEQKGNLAGESSGEMYHTKCSKPLYRLKSGLKLSDILCDGHEDSYFTLPGLPECEGGVVVSDSIINCVVPNGDILLFQRVAPSNAISSKRYLIAVENDEGKEELSLEYVIRVNGGRVIQTFASKPEELRSIDLKRVRTLLLVVGLVSIQR